MLFEFFNLDGYTNLWDKFHDEFRDEFREERHWVAENYNSYFRRASRNDRRRMQTYRTNNDYMTLYYFMAAMDGNERAQYILENAEE